LVKSPHFERDSHAAARSKARILTIRLADLRPAHRPDPLKEPFARLQITLVSHGPGKVEALRQNR
jgi:hypothetical protein